MFLYTYIVLFLVFVIGLLPLLLFHFIFGVGYLLIVKIGSGSYGIVYLVQDLNTKEYYALKEVPKSRTVSDEVKILTAIKHPLVVCTYVETPMLIILDLINYMSLIRVYILIIKKNKKIIYYCNNRHTALLLLLLINFQQA